MIGGYLPRISCLHINRIDDLVRIVWSIEKEPQASKLDERVALLRADVPTQTQPRLVADKASPQYKTNS